MVRHVHLAFYASLALHRLVKLPSCRRRSYNYN